MAEIKQVIVMRKDLGMRKGKMIAQACHASNKILLNEIAIYGELQPITTKWLGSNYTKICVSVNSEAELNDIFRKAHNQGIPATIVTDLGLTEFNGELNKTCVAIGPFDSEIINAITGNLPLL